MVKNHEPLTKRNGGMTSRSTEHGDEVSSSPDRGLQHGWLARTHTPVRHSRERRVCFDVFEKTCKLLRYGGYPASTSNELQ